MGMDEAEKLLERMRATPFGWKDRDLESLYLGFGFERRDGSNHRIYWHPHHPELYAVVPRHRQVKGHYVIIAIRHILRLKELEADHE